MSFRARQPGCPCCGDECLIDVAGWDVRAGIWDTSVIETGSSNGLIVTTNDHPDESNNHVVMARVKGGSDGDIIRIVVAYEDDNNYLFIELEVGDTCGQLRLYERKVGTTTQLGEDVPLSTLTPGEFHEVKVCCESGVEEESETGKLTVLLATHANEKREYVQDVTVNGTRVGIATGSLGEASKATIESFEWYKHQTDDPECPNCVSEKCLIIADSFDNADSLECIWHQASGTWGIESSVLSSVGAGLIVNQVPHVEEGGSKHVSVSVKSPNDGDSVGVSVDLDNDGVGGHRAVLTVGTEATLKLFKGDTELKTVSIIAANGEWHTMNVCLLSTTFQATVGNKSLATQTTRDGGNHVGLYSSSAAEFDSFVYSIHGIDREGCPSCVISVTCSACLEQESALYYKVRFSGIETNEVEHPEWPECECPYETILLEQTFWYEYCLRRAFYPNHCGEPSKNSTIECRFRAGPDRISSSLSAIDVPSGKFGVSIKIRTWADQYHASEIWYHKEYDEPIECFELDDFIPFALHIIPSQKEGWPEEIVCDGSNSTCQITAI